MSLSRIFSIVVRQFYLLRGSLSRFVPIFAWVAVDMILWGFLTRYLNTVASPGFNFVPALLGAVLLWDFFIRIMHGITMAFLEDVWSRNFLNIFASPLLISEYVTGLVLSSIATSLLALGAMFSIAVLCFKLSFVAYGLMILPFLMVLFLFGISIGILGSALVLRFGPASEWFIWPLPALISPFAGGCSILSRRCPFGCRGCRVSSRRLMSLKACGRSCTGGILRKWRSFGEGCLRSCIFFWRTGFL